MKAVCVGIVVADIIGRPIDAFPAPGTLALVPSISPHLGGCAANTGIGLQKLGVQTVVAAKIGRDGLGDFVKSQLETAGVQSALACDPDAPTSATMVLVQSNAQRSFLHCTGANATFDIGDFDLDLLDGADLLHIAGHGLLPRFDGMQCAQLLGLARARGLRTSLDTAGAPDARWCENLRLCLPHLDFFVPSLHEASALFPDEGRPSSLAARLVKAGAKIVALKMGERGSFVCDAFQSFEVPAFSIRAVDTTGAGDAFAAGFLASALRGFSLLDCARMGNAAGALVSLQVGAVAGHRSFDETWHFSRGAPFGNPTNT